jgi:voltage-gated potassium channel
VAPLSRLRAAALLVVAVVVTGVLGYCFLEGYTWFDALFMTAITLSTVGFQEVQPLSQVGRLFTVDLLAAGLGVVFYTVVALAEQEFQRVFGRRRMEKRIGALHAHYLVADSAALGRLSARNWPPSRCLLWSSNIAKSVPARQRRRNTSYSRAMRPTNRPSWQQV